MRKLSISLSKGGVGKTTTAVNLSAALAQLDYDVLLVDTDTQGHCAKILGMEPQAGLAELMLEEANPKEAVTQARPHLDLLAGSPKLAQAKRLMAREDLGPEKVLTEALKPFSGYDFVVVDSAPGWDTMSVNVLFYADEVLCPVSLEALSVTGLADFMEQVKRIQGHRRGLEVKWILPTFMDRRVAQSEEILEQLIVVFGSKLCRPIRYSVRLSEAPAHGQTIFEYAPKDRGAIDYAKLTGEVLKNGTTKD